MPPVAQDIHRANIENVVNKTFQIAGLTPKELDAIAVTNRPEGTNRFRLLGETLDDAPGEALDKIARRLKLRNVAKYEHMSGGQAIELAALAGASQSAAYDFPLPLSKYRDCQFSFAGLKNTATRHILEQEARHSEPSSSSSSSSEEPEDWCHARKSTTSSALLEQAAVAGAAAAVVAQPVAPVEEFGNDGEVEISNSENFFDSVEGNRQPRRGTALLRPCDSAIVRIGELSTSVGTSNTTKLEVQWKYKSVHWE
ncbi:hypothetical protein AND_001381 [Anopheles darlingi]|uniref:Gcp-like domain-containing protein n=1 Tax=Anopheles darlingi TaxID=43151 RepID=W5JR07_ANODA|nr:hypothetical protein AND_001381 [Anopheles darlingi]